MLKNFKNGYAISGSDQTASSETKDCAVRAIANACDVNYSQAHKYCSDVFKRKKGQGTQKFLETMNDIEEMVFEQAGQLDLFNTTTTKTITQLGYAPKFKDGKNIGGELNNPKYKHKKVAFTVKEFAQQYNKGNFIIGVNKHALAIKNGVVVDNSNYQYGGYRRIVEGAYQVQ
tara:strand:+ start:130 stop:648 length:519 start_codon:yes stop_codon:yes gene_type:complete